MNRPLQYSTAVFALLSSLFIVKPEASLKNNVCLPLNKSTEKTPKIQAAILLDVSGSMNGLIEQAKSQLWNMVNVIDKVKCENGLPKIEIALYEYGNNTNDEAAGYLKQISAFTNDLNRLSNELNNLTTNGSEEYCGQVIYTSLLNLDWDTSAASYKVIFIAGNEDFLQGKISYTKACNEAKKKGVIVNTIYCGDRNQGIINHWNLGAECGNGSFTNIDQNAKEKQIPTPYDSSIFLLNQKINRTYITYGISGKESFEAFTQSDTVPMYDLKDVNKMVTYKVVKSNGRLFNNSAWDLVDATEKDSSVINKVDMNTLADSLKSKSRDDLKQILDTKIADRNVIRKQIAEMNAKRDAHIMAEKAKSATEYPKILKTEIERIIREQVKRFNMYIE